MAEEDKAGRVDLEDLTAAVAAGLSRAMAARSVGRKGWRHFPILVGFIADPPLGDWSQLPPFQTDDDEPGPLRARDHTVIIEAIVRFVLPLLHDLGLLKERAKPVSASQILASLGRVAAISAEVQNALRRVAAARKFVPEAAELLDRAAGDGKADPRVQKLLAKVRAAASVDAKIDVLNKARAESSGEVAGLAQGIEAAITILQDGKQSIYNPDFYLEVFGGSGEAASVAKQASGEIASADVEGAIGGAIAVGGAAAVGGPAATVAGVAGGAVLGGVGGSTAKAVSLLLDWLF